jgi:hypothetical protein
MLLLYLISRHGYSNNLDVLIRFKCWVPGQGGHACEKSTVYQTTPTPVVAFIPSLLATKTNRACEDFEQIPPLLQSL